VLTGKEVCKTQRRGVLTGKEVCKTQLQRWVAVRGKAGQVPGETRAWTYSRTREGERRTKPQA